MLRGQSIFPKVHVSDLLTSCKQHLFVNVSQVVHVPHHLQCNHPDKTAQLTRTRKAVPVPKFAFYCRIICTCQVIKIKWKIMRFCLQTQEDFGIPIPQTWSLPQGFKFLLAPRPLLCQEQAGAQLRASRFCEDKSPPGFDRRQQLPLW